MFANKKKKYVVLPLKVFRGVLKLVSWFKLEIENLRSYLIFVADAADIVRGEFSCHVEKF